MGCRQGGPRSQGRLAGAAPRCPAMPSCTRPCAPPRRRIRSWSTRAIWRMASRRPPMWRPRTTTALSGACAVRAQLRARRCRPGRGAGHVLDPGRLQFPQNARRHARPAGREGARAVLRRLRHLRPQLLRRCGPSRRHHVAGGGQAGARAVHALGRARLGQLRAGASRRGARRRRPQRQDRRLRVPGLAARLACDRDLAGAGSADQAAGAHQRIELDHRQPA